MPGVVLYVHPLTPQFLQWTKQLVPFQKGLDPLKQKIFYYLGSQCCYAAFLILKYMYYLIGM